MKPAELTVHSLDVEAIRPFIERSRGREAFERMKQSMDKHGLKIPIQVRDISDTPAKDRQRPNGGHYRFELIAGQGRLEAAKELAWKKIPAFVIDAPEAEIVGRFLAENMIRKPLPWVEKARLVKWDLDAGMSVEDVAAKFFVGPKHALKMAKILGKVATDIDLSDLSLTDADILTTLPADDQLIVVSVLRDTGAVEGNVAAAVAKARAIKADGEALSSQALKKSITRVGSELEDLQRKLKVKRLHYAIGPQNVQLLLARPEFAAAIKSARISTEAFESLTA